MGSPGFQSVFYNVAFKLVATYTVYYWCMIFLPHFRTSGPGRHWAHCSKALLYNKPGSAPGSWVILRMPSQWTRKSRKRQWQRPPLIGSLHMELDLDRVVALLINELARSQITTYWYASLCQTPQDDLSVLGSGKSIISITRMVCTCINWVNLKEKLWLEVQGKVDLCPIHPKITHCTHCTRSAVLDLR